MTYNLRIQRFWMTPAENQFMQEPISKQNNVLSLALRRDR